MTTILLADTDPKITKIVHDVEAMCHEAGLGIVVHHEGEDIKEIFDSVDAKVIAFSPKGRLDLDQMFEKYWPKEKTAQGDKGAPVKACTCGQGCAPPQPGTELLLVVGGFLKGDFKSRVYDRADDTVSLGSKLLPIPDVIEKIIEAYKRHVPARHEFDFGCCV